MKEVLTNPKLSDEELQKFKELWYKAVSNYIHTRVPVLGLSREQAKEEKEDDMSYIDEPTQRYSASGRKVINANEITLQIDIDSEEDFKRWQEGSEILLNAIGYHRLDMHPSKSGFPHRHITIILNEPADIWKRIALQICLGSHLTRETLNSYRVLVESECPIVFFEKVPKPRRMIRISE